MNRPAQTELANPDTASKSPEKSLSPWSPLAEPIFRALWIATVASNIGTWMQDVGESWLMVSLTTSPMLVALVETAGSLPIVLLALPAGALADVVDRRRLLLITLSWMLVSAAAMGLLTLAGMATPWLLLVLTFTLGLGTAMNGPAFQAILRNSAAPGDTGGRYSRGGGCQCFACCRPGARRASGCCRWIWSRLSAQCGFVPRSDGRDLPLAAGTSTEHTAAGTCFRRDARWSPLRAPCAGASRRVSAYRSFYRVRECAVGAFAATGQACSRTGLIWLWHPPRLHR